jgi:hypothetical protein
MYGVYSSTPLIPEEGPPPRARSIQVVWSAWVPERTQGKPNACPCHKPTFHRPTHSQFIAGFAVFTVGPLANTKPLLIGRTWSPLSHHRDINADFIKGKEIRQPVGSASSRCRYLERMERERYSVWLVCGQGRVPGCRTGLVDKKRAMRDCLLLRDNEWASAVNYYARNT